MLYNKKAPIRGFFVVVCFSLVYYFIRITDTVYK